MFGIKWRLGRKAVKKGLQMMWKSSSDIDAIGHIMIGGAIKHVPLSYNYEKSRWETLNDEDPEFWNDQSEANNQYRIAGNVPTVWASSKTNELGSHVQAEVAEALDLGAGRDLYTDAQVNHIKVEGANPGPNGAIADGGQAQQQGREWVDIHDPGSLEDQLVDLGSGSSARVVSMNKYYETYPEKTDTEEMKRQEWRGIESAKDDEELREMMLKLFMIAGGIVVLSFAAAFILPELLGGGGSGGGSILGMLSLIGG
jgi:hypothetical protein